MPSVPTNTQVYSSISNFYSLITLMLFSAHCRVFGCVLNTIALLMLNVLLILFHIAFKQFEEKFHEIMVLNVIISVLSHDVFCPILVFLGYG